MKRVTHLIFTISVLLGVSPPVMATTQFAPLRTKTPSGSYTVELNPRMKDALVVYDRNNAIVSSHTIDALGFTVRERLDHIKYSTAGLSWYHPNALTFFSLDERFYFLHLPWGKTIVFDLTLQRAADGIPADSAAFVTNRLQTEAVSLLESGRNEKERRDALAVALRLTNATERIAAVRALSTTAASRNRETGAMICGHLGLTNAIPALTALLADDAYTTVGGGDVWRRVYYVRKAARDALTAMGQSVDNVVIEEIIEKPGASNKVPEDTARKLADPQH